MIITMIYSLLFKINNLIKTRIKYAYRKRLFKLNIKISRDDRDVLSL